MSKESIEKAKEYLKKFNFDSKGIGFHKDGTYLKKKHILEVIEIAGEVLDYTDVYNGFAKAIAKEILSEKPDDIFIAKATAAMELLEQMEGDIKTIRS